MTSTKMLSIHVELGGGTELLTAPPQKKKHTIEIPALIKPSKVTATKKPGLLSEAAVTSPESSASELKMRSSEEIARPADMSYLIAWIRDNLLVERHELFVDTIQSAPPTTTNNPMDAGKAVAESDTSADSRPLTDATVRPGILVLINDADWELEGETRYQLEDGDEVSFISTLHGG